MIEMKYKGYKIKEVDKGYKVYVRWLLFWWIPIQTPLGYYTFMRKDRIFDTVAHAKSFIDGKE
jgi:hypothetical protein